MNVDTPAAYMDEEGNIALNIALEKKSDDEKHLLKSILDLTIHTEFKDGKPYYRQNINMSKEEVVTKLEAKVAEQRELECHDISGFIDVVEKFIQFYKSGKALQGARQQTDFKY